jgi:hypothetical protein
MRQIGPSSPDREILGVWNIDIDIGILDEAAVQTQV